MKKGIIITILLLLSCDAVPVPVEQRGICNSSMIAGQFEVFSCKDEIYNGRHSITIIRDKKYNREYIAFETISGLGLTERNMKW